jgi:tetratricopeptide (TPR) repeat protein
LLNGYFHLVNLALVQYFILFLGAFFFFVSPYRFPKTSLNRWVFFLILSFLPSLFISSYFHQSFSCFLLWILYLGLYYIFLTYLKLEIVEVINLIILGGGVIQILLVGYQRFFLNDYFSHGTLYNLNHLTLYLSCGLGVILAHLKYQSLSRFKQFFFIFLAVIFYFVIIYLRSRTGLVVLFFISFYYLKKLKFNPPQRYLLLFLFLVPLLFFLPRVIPRFFFTQHLGDPFDYTRFKIWVQSLRMFKDYWLLGSGLGTYRYLSFQYLFPVEGSISRFGHRAISPHNEWLHLAVEAGGISLILVVVLLIIIFKKAKNQDLTYQTLVARLGLGSIFIFSLTSGIFRLPIVCILTFYFLSLLSPIKKEPVRQKSSRKVKAGQIIFLLVCFLFVTKSLLAYLFFWQGVREEQGGNIERAYFHYRKAALIDYFSAEYWAELGEFCQEQYKRTGKKSWADQGVKFYQQAIELNTSHPQYYYQLAQFSFSLFQKGKKKDFLTTARFFTQRALAINPKNTFYYFLLGQIEKVAGNKENFEKNMKKCLELEPNFLAVYFQLGNFYEKEGRYQEAYRLYWAGLRQKKLIRTSPRGQFERDLVKGKRINFLKNLKKLKKLKIKK